MKALDGAVSPTDALKAARAGLKSAEASVTAAKKDAKAAKSKRKEAKEMERLARKRLRRAKKELREVKRTLATAEASRPKLVRRLKPVRLAKPDSPTTARGPTPLRAARKKSVRKRAIPALTRDTSRKLRAVTPPVETSNSEPKPEPPAAEPALVAAEEASQPS